MGPRTDGSLNLTFQAELFSLQKAVITLFKRNYLSVTLLSDFRETKITSPNVPRPIFLILS